MFGKMIVATIIVGLCISASAANKTYDPKDKCSTYYTHTAPGSDGMAVATSINNWDSGKTLMLAAIVHVGAVGKMCDVKKGDILSFDIDTEVIQFDVISVDSSMQINDSSIYESVVFALSEGEYAHFAAAGSIVCSIKSVRYQFTLADIDTFRDVYIMYKNDNH